MNKLILIFFLFTHLLNAQTLDDLEFGTDTTLDIVSWNIEWFPKNSSTSNYVEEILRNLNADIYALQEIDDTILLKQVVSNISGYETYFKSSYYGGLAYVYNSNTISVNDQYEIYTSQQYWNAFPRSPQVLDCNFFGKNYILINNHFKCCGDGFLNLNIFNDEENRRKQAANYLKQYVDSNFSFKNVIILGDLNDNLVDPNVHNVFINIINDTLNYFFADINIAQSTSANWSYPSWPSHLDHILITNELFQDFSHPTSKVEVIKLDEYMNGWNSYENNVSDHRPIGLKLKTDALTFNDKLIHQEKKIVKIFDIFGLEHIKKKPGINIILFDDGSYKKEFYIK